MEFSTRRVTTIRIVMDVLLATVQRCKAEPGLPVTLAMARSGVKVHQAVAVIAVAVPEEVQQVVLVARPCIPLIVQLAMAQPVPTSMAERLALYPLLL